MQDKIDELRRVRAQRDQALIQRDEDRAEIVRLKESYKESHKEWEHILRIIERERNQAQSDTEELRIDLAQATTEVARLKERLYEAGL